MSSTVVGVFEDQTNATRAQQALIQAGVNASAIHITRGDTLKVHDAKEPGFWESVKEAFGFSDAEDQYSYAEAARRGSTVLSVTTDDNQAERVADIIDQYNPIDLNQREAEWRKQGWTGYSAASAGQAASAGTAATRSTAATASAAATTRPAAAVQRVEGEQAIPVVQEELKVGKRAVRAGGVRVHTRVIETPVQEQVNLRQEHVHVERTPVNRPVTAADQVFKDKVIEATETREEAVVSKEARVVEEVRVRKDVEQQAQTVRDTVRRTDVNVEQIDTDPQYEPARQFATTLSGDQRYKGRTWDQIEPDARTSFEKNYPGRKWDEFRDAVRSRYDRAGSTSKTNA